ncbi:MAG TPA: DUF5985 family protein [Caulobacteraceae bacterium]|jgi:hypothetical protein
MGTVATFVSGMIAMGYIVAGLLFLRFWRRTGDGLFAVFAAAFWLFALNQALVALLGVEGDERGWIYLLRLAAFSLIIAAVLRKNLGSRGG